MKHYLTINIQRSSKLKVQPKVYAEHEIDQKQIDPDALFTINKLKQAGFAAYLVGGGVRDLLIKKTPKDFDISTSALPEQIKHLFSRNCLLIGKRFRLAHVRFGHKILEVSTFRSGENDSDLILRDNRWGTAEQDAMRRDFTINGLFYDPTNHTIIDYVGGWEDIHKHTLRTIGNPTVRFKQDPVRMLRLLKFRARFGFNIDLPTQKALIDCKEEIIKSSPARILEEILRMLESGSAAAFLKLINDTGMLELLFPTLTHFLDSRKGQEIYHYLQEADKLNQNNSKNLLDRSLLLSCLLYPILEHEIRTQYTSKNIHPHVGQIMLLTSSLIHAFVTSSFPHFPKKISSMTSFIMSTQYRLTPLSGKKHLRPKLFHIKEFGHAIQFLKLRALVNEELLETYSTWNNLYKQHAKPHEHKHHAPPSHRKKNHEREEEEEEDLF